MDQQYGIKKICGEI